VLRTKGADGIKLETSAGDSNRNWPPRGLGRQFTGFRLDRPRRSSRTLVAAAEEVGVHRVPCLNKVVGWPG
jgi:hypothetical protein